MNLSFPGLGIHRNLQVQELAIFAVQLKSIHVNTNAKIARIWVGSAGRFCVTAIFQADALKHALLDSI
jgi:hypothetical protein